MHHLQANVVKDASNRTRGVADRLGDGRILKKGGSNIKGGSYPSAHYYSRIGLLKVISDIGVFRNIAGYRGIARYNKINSARTPKYPIFFRSLVPSYFGSPQFVVS